MPGGSLRAVGALAWLASLVFTPTSELRRLPKPEKGLNEPEANGVEAAGVDTAAPRDPA